MGYSPVLKMIINRCTHTQSLIHVWLFTAPQTGPPGSSVHRIFQSRMQEWVAISYSRGSFQPRDQHRLLHFLHCTWILYHCATWEAHQWMKALQMVFIIYAVLNFPNLLQLLHIGLVTKKIQNVYNIALTLVTTVSKIMLTLIVLLFSVQFSHSVVSDSLWPHELQHTRPPCPSPTPRVYSNSCPWSWWCHPAISDSVVPFSSCPQSLPASESFPMSQLFSWDGQSIGVSASVSVLPKNTQDWSPLWWTGWISLQFKGLSRVFSNTTVQKHKFFCAQLSS